MGRKRIHPKKIDGLKIKKVEQPPQPEPEGAYGYTALLTDGFGLYRPLKGVVDAKNHDEVVKHIDGKIPEGWRLVKLAIAFIGLFLCALPVSIAVRMR